MSDRASVKRGEMVGLEIEVKLRVADPSGLRGRLRAVGGRAGSSNLEINRIFDSAEGALRKRGCVLRVRELRSLHGDETSSILTFKIPRDDDDDGAVKTRQELETLVGEAGVTIAVLGELGYREKIHYEKRRETWQVGTCEVVIDELPTLGWFVEIEGESAAAVRDCQARLSLDGAEVMKDSYVAMTARHGEDLDGVKTLRFS